MSRCPRVGTPNRREIADDALPGRLTLTASTDAPMTRRDQPRLDLFDVFEEPEVIVDAVRIDPAAAHACGEGGETVVVSIDQANRAPRFSNRLHRRADDTETQLPRVAEPPLCLPVSGYRGDDHVDECPQPPVHTGAPTADRARRRSLRAMPGSGHRRPPPGSSQRPSTTKHRPHGGRRTRRSGELAAPFVVVRGRSRSCDGLRAYSVEIDDIARGRTTAGSRRRRRRPAADSLPRCEHVLRGSGRQPARWSVIAQVTMAAATMRVGASTSLLPAAAATDRSVTSDSAVCATVTPVNPPRVGWVTSSLAMRCRSRRPRPWQHPRATEVAWRRLRSPSGGCDG